MGLFDKTGDFNKREALKGMSEKQLLKFLAILTWDTSNNYTNEQLIEIAKEA